MCCVGTPSCNSGCWGWLRRVKCKLWKKALRNMEGLAMVDYAVALLISLSTSVLYACLLGNCAPFVVLGTKERVKVCRCSALNLHALTQDRLLDFWVSKHGIHGLRQLINDGLVYVSWRQ